MFPICPESSSRSRASSTSYGAARGHTFFPSLKLTEVIPISTCLHKNSSQHCWYRCRSTSNEYASLIFSRISKPVYYFTLSWEWDSEDVADGFCFCHWRHGNISITVKCVFISAFLLHPHGSPVTFVCLLGA